MNRMLVAWRTGAGKTMAIVEALNNYRFDPRPKILIFPTSSLVDNFVTELLEIDGFYREHVIRVLSVDPRPGMKRLVKNIQRYHIDVAEVKVAREILEMKDRFKHISQHLTQLRHIAQMPNIATRLKTGKNQPRFTDARRKVYEQYQYFLDQGKWPDIFVPRSRLVVMSYAQAGGATAGQNTRDKRDLHTVFKHRAMGLHAFGEAGHTILERATNNDKKPILKKKKRAIVSLVDNEIKYDKKAVLSYDQRDYQRRRVDKNLRDEHLRKWAALLDEEYDGNETEKHYTIVGGLEDDFVNPESLEDLKIKERLLLSIIDEGQLNAMKEKGISLSKLLLSESTTPFKEETRFFVGRDEEQRLLKELDAAQKVGNSAEINKIEQKIHELQVTSVYDHCIVIMDEFHNLITQSGKYADKLQYLSNEFANCGDNTILIGMTATPIVESKNDHEEIARIFRRKTLKGCVSYFNDLHPSLYPALQTSISAGGKRKRKPATTTTTTTTTEEGARYFRDSRKEGNHTFGWLEMGIW